MERLSDIEIRDLLYAYFNGDTDANDNKIIERWLKESPDNEELYDDVLKRHLFTKWSIEEEDIDSAFELQRLSRSIHKRKRLTPRIKIAASILLILTAGVIFMLAKEERIRYREGVIEPITPRATLILSDGQTLNLTNQDLFFQEDNGVIFSVNPEEGMSYSTESLTDTTLLFHKIIVPRGGEFSITLSDGTKVWLNSDTEFEFPLRFLNNDRDVFVNGEAYFKVAHNDNQKFNIHKEDYLLTVYGTEFNINTYRPEKIEVALLSGYVGIKVGEEKECFIDPGQLAVTNLKRGETRIESVNLKPYLAWINKDIIFNGKRLEEIMEDIARWYDVDIFFRSSTAKNIMFDINIERYAEIEDFLYLLEKTSEVKFTLKGKTVIIDMY